jgi:hypothetical protein
MSRRFAWVAVGVWCGLTGLVLGQDGPDNDPDAAPGYVNNFFDHNPIDSVNLYNGQLTVPISLGPSYPIGPKLKLQLVLNYNSRVDEYGTAGSFQTPDFNLGRFISVDKVGGRVRNPQSWNRYSYSLSNPLKYLDPDGFEVTYADKRLQNFFGRLTVRFPAVKDALGRYTGPGKPDLRIQRGDAGYDHLTGEKSRGVFRVDNAKYNYQRPDGSYTVSDSAGKDQMNSTGKNLTGATFDKATLTIDTSVTPGTKDEANVAVHEVGHADSAANDFLRFSQQSADDENTGPDGKPLPHDDRPLEQEANQFRDRVCGAQRDCDPY